MCGRYTLTAPGDAIVEAFELPGPVETRPRYNITPTQEVAAVRVDGKGGERTLVNLKWGLVPRWADDPSIGNRMINARSETVAEKPAFRWAFKKQRCLVLADGYYEWKKLADGSKQPYYFRVDGGRPFGFAGLWERWSREGEEVQSCALLTTSPNDLAAAVHDRMPVILAEKDYDLWLDPSVGEAEKLNSLLVAYSAGAMETWPVSRFVNKPGNDSPRCIEPVTEGAAPSEG